MTVYRVDALDGSNRFRCVEADTPEEAARLAMAEVAFLVVEAEPWTLWDEAVESVQQFANDGLFRVGEANARDLLVVSDQGSEVLTTEYVQDNYRALPDTFDTTPITEREEFGVEDLLRAIGLA